MSAHIPVLATEVQASWCVDPNGYYLDATFGRGGHSRALLERLSPEGQLWVYDCDREAIEVARSEWGGDARVHIRHANFKEIGNDFSATQQGTFQGVLFDLGICSTHVDEQHRGFSFLSEGPLDMRLDDRIEPLSEKLLNVSEKALADVIYEYGEERHSRKIAKAMISAKHRLHTTLDLAHLIENVLPSRGRIHPATKTFQALRIWVNDELTILHQAFESAVALLKPGGRLLIIAFHSLEDRISKRFIRHHPHVSAWGRMIRPSVEEIKTNPRARSACLRIAEKQV